MSQDLKTATPLRLGIAGLGTVGMGVVKIVQEKADLLALRTGRPVVITAVSARSQSKDRGFDLSGYAWETDPVKLATRDDIDVFVEVMGGHDGPAKDATEAAIKAGKDVVTANKALLAHHGQDLAAAAENASSVLRFEAAVAGGIPVVKTLTEGLAGNGITRIVGVMNGTCNYILTRMEATGNGYNTLFNECAELGYLEADPNLDVGGIDAGHKLSLLASIAFGTKVNFDAVELEGIQRITNADIKHAADMGYKIKLLGVTQMTGRGLEQRMTPCLVPASSPFGQLEGGTNMVVLEGDEVGQIVLRGAGAGMGPTASAVMSDILDIARGTRISTFGQPANTLVEATTAVAATTAPYYLRLGLTDKPGALAKITTALGDAGVSIDRMSQPAQDEGVDVAPVLIVTDPTGRSDLNAAIDTMNGTGLLVGEPIAIRIETV
jgi:homoserine dehydrogenase